jgi:hypothetical protein
MIVDQEPTWVTYKWYVCDGARYREKGINFLSLDETSEENVSLIGCAVR